MTKAKPFWSFRWDDEATDDVDDEADAVVEENDKKPSDTTDDEDG